MFLFIILKLKVVNILYLESYINRFKDWKSIKYPDKIFRTRVSLFYYRNIHATRIRSFDTLLYKEKLIRIRWNVIFEN